MLLSYLFTYLSIIKLTQSQCSSNSGTCNIRCDGYPSCRDTTITCPSYRDCVVDCYYNPDRRLLIQYPIHHIIQQRNLLSVYTCSGNSYGCCNSVINCPANQNCEVDCQRGCDGVTIYAQNSDTLLVSNCDQSSSQNYCGNMEIYCPRNGRGGTQNICEIEGSSTSYEIENSNIYTEEGFNDVYFNTVHTSNTRVYCGKTASEYSCIVASNGNECDSTEPTICNNFIIPTPEPTPPPTPSPTSSPTFTTNTPSIPPTKFPTKTPTKSPTNYPSVSPTKTPSKSPTNMPTMTPTTNAPSISPSENPTNVPTTPSPTLHAHSSTSTPSTKRPTLNPIIMTTVENEADIIVDENGHFWQSTVGVDLEVILIALCAVLLMCCICLFICYWCRKESIYRQLRSQLEDKEKSTHLYKPLLQQQDNKMCSNENLEMFDVIAPESYGLQAAIKNVQKNIFNTIMSDGETDSDEDLVLGNMETGGNISESSEGIGNDDDVVNEINRQETQSRDDTNNLNWDEFVINDDGDQGITPFNNENKQNLLQMNENDNQAFIDVSDDSDDDSDDDQLETTQGFIQ